MKKKLFSLLAAGALALCALTPTAYALTPALDII